MKKDRTARDKKALELRMQRLRELTTRDLTAVAGGLPTCATSDTGACETTSGPACNTCSNCTLSK